MKRICIIVIFLLFGVIISGCLNAEKPNEIADPKKEDDESTTKESNIVFEEALKYYQDGSGTEFFYMNFEEIRSDQDLDQIYKEIENSFDYNLKIKPNDIKYGLTNFNDEVIIGNFDLVTLENDLKRADFIHKEYLRYNITIMVNGDDNHYIAFLNNNSLLYSEEMYNMGDMIEASKSKRSLYYNNDLRKILEKLDGFAVRFNVEEKFNEYDCIFGASITKKNENELNHKLVIIFSSSEGAENSFTDLEDIFKKEYKGMKVYREGNMIIGVNVIDIDDWKVVEF